MNSLGALGTFQIAVPSGGLILEVFSQGLKFRSVISDVSFQLEELNVNYYKTNCISLELIRETNLLQKPIANSQDETIKTN
jgi:hypothetical protein